MVERYFDKFPTISYTSNTAIDITKRTALLNKVSSNPLVFYPYELDVYERPEQLSNRYYQDPYQSWLIYLTNKIVDPYYEWYLQQNEFDEFIKQKYGSIQTAIQKTKHYRHDWVDKSNISVSNYNSMPANIRKYWQPIYGMNGNIAGYSRIKSDWVVNTNKIIEYSVANSSFTNNEICDIVFSNNFTGTGQVNFSTDKKLYLHHVAGSYITSNTVSIVTATDYVYSQSDAFVADGVQVSFIIPPLVDNNNCLVTVDGLVQELGTHYNITGPLITFTSSPVVGASVEVRNMEIASTVYATDHFIGDSLKSQWTLSFIATRPNNIIVTIDGLIQIPGINYLLINSTVKFTSIPVAGSIITVKNLDFINIKCSSQVSSGSGGQQYYPMNILFSSSGDIVDSTVLVPSGASILSPTINDMLVTIDGILQIPYVNYTLSDTDIYFTSPPQTGSFIEFRNILKVLPGTSYIYGRESGTNTSFTTSVCVANNINFDEEVYWKPLSFYDYENERNEYNKSIRLLDNRYSRIAVNNLKDLMEE